MSKARYHRAASLLTRFLTWQLLVQALNMTTGFLLLRWLDVKQYAQYSVAFSFQSTLGILSDLGFSGCIIALVGERTGDGSVIGSYIRSAKYFRLHLFFIVATVSLLAFPWVIHHQHWGLMTNVLLFGSIAASVFFQGGKVYAAPLLIQRRLPAFYCPQALAGALRIALCLGLYAARCLSAAAAAWIGSLSLGIVSIFYKRAGMRLISEPSKSDPAINREMLRYLMPLLPGIVFAAFQGQIMVALITIFGKAKNIAEVAVLGRIGLLFFVLGAFNSVIIEPYIAKTAYGDLRRRYLQMAGAAAAVAGCLTGIAFLCPQPLLWLIGPRYEHLRPLIGWAVMSACLEYVAGVLWTMNSARKWIFWWYTALTIGLVLAVQIAAVSLMEMSVTRNVIFFGVFGSAALVVAHGIGAAYGLTRRASARLVSSV